MKHHLKIQLIVLRFHYRILRIHLRKYRKLVCITIAGWLVKLAFRISPTLRDQMGFHA
jgi:hypothetical protein